MFAVMLLSGGCYVTLYPCVSEVDQNYDSLPAYWPNLMEARIEEQAMTAVLMGTTRWCQHNYLSQLSQDTDGDTLGNIALGTQTSTYVDVSWNGPYTSEQFASAWNMCSENWKNTATKFPGTGGDPTCGRHWISWFHGCYDFGSATQFNGNYITRPEFPLFQTAVFRGNWARTSLGYRPGECTVGNQLDHYNLSPADLLQLIEKGTKVRYAGVDCIALPLSSDTTQLTLSQGAVSQPLELGDYENTLYITVDGLHPLMEIDAADKKLITPLTTYANFLEQIEPGKHFSLTLNYDGVTGVFPYAGLDENKEVLESVRNSINFLNQ
jgi:hypothetical protein